MNHITSHVAQLLQSCSQEHYWKFLLMSKWNEIMGSLACKVSIHKIHQKTIVLGVYDSCWMQELNLLSELIKEKINQILGSNRIESIKLKYMVPSNKMIQKKERPKPFTHTQKTLSPSEIQALEQIKDQELAQALVGFLQKCHQFS